MAKKKLVNAVTDQSVPAFIEAIANKKRRADSQAMLQIIREVTGLEPKIWGVSIVGFGQYEYQRKNGDTYEWFHVGFSPARAHLTLYVMFDLSQEQALLDQLGPHRKGKGCLYIKRLAEVDVAILKQLIEKSKRWER